MLRINGKPRVVGTLVGDVYREPNARTKYLPLFEALKQHIQLVDIHDVTLRGVARFFNALQVIHFDRHQWRERFYKNIPAFRTRSKGAVSYLKTLDGKVDVVLQLGVLFDARWDDAPTPSVIYTDYTAHLSARKIDVGRSPFSPQQLEQWVSFERQAFQRAAHICTRGEFVRDSIINDYNISPDQVTTIGGGVNFSVLPEESTRTGNHNPTILCIGKDFYRKGGDLLLQAFARVHARYPKSRLLFLTEGPIPGNLSLSGVEIIAPTWDREVIAGLYQEADLFVLPSRLETWGDVLLEAMAYRLPCVGVADEGMPEIIVDGVTGFVTPPEDADSLAEALARLLSDDQLRHQMGCAARQRVEQVFTWDITVEHLAAIINAVAERQLSPSIRTQDAGEAL